MEKKDIQKLANLARITVTEEEEERLLFDINSILEYVDQVQKTVVDRDSDKSVGTPHNVLRDDEKPHPKGKYSDEILKNAPETEGRYVKVKKIL